MTRSLLLFACCGLLLALLSRAQVKPAEQDGAQDSGTEADPSTSLTFVPKYSKLLDASELQTLKASQSIGTVYYYKEDTAEWDKDFLSKYDKSAGFLNAYGLTLGLVDCSGSGLKELEEECSQMSEMSVYTFRNGARVLELAVANMFDVDSIMSNILILVLMEEVPIVQTKESRQQLERHSAKQKDVVIAYLSYVGTYESRVFMEIAYAYQDKYKFVVTSEMATTTDLQDSDLLSEGSESSVSMIWVLYCRDRYDAASGCRSVNYRGRVNLVDLATFFKQLDWPRVVRRPEGSTGERHPCELSVDMGCVVISHTPASKVRANTLVDSLQFDLHGLVGLIVLEKSSSVTVQDGKDYPQIILQKPGGENITVNGRLELAMIETMIAMHLLPDLERSTGDTVREETDVEEEASPIDDMVVHVAYEQRQTISDVPHIPALNDSTFPALTTHSKLMLVLFYIPFDAEGMVFLRPFQEAGLKLAALKGQDPAAHPLARINCFDWTDVCQRENITSYPVVHIYRDGQRQQYRHALDTDVLVRTVLLLQADQPLMLKSEREVTSFLEGRLPTPAYSDMNNMVILKLSASRKETWAYKAVVKTLETQMLFAMVGPDVKTDFVPSGGVLHKRTKDPDQPMETLAENLDAASIISFLQKGQFSLFPELTFLNFPALFARREPLGILFYQPSLPGAADLQHAIVTHLQNNRHQDLLFCKMTVGDSNPEARHLLMNYTQTEDLPAFTVVNHHKGAVYVLQGGEMKASVLLPWIESVQNGRVAPSKMLDRGEWKPSGQHYDFLAILDREKKMKGQKKQTDSTDSFQQDDSVDVHQEQDMETRASLLELQRSRLYHGKDRWKLPTPAAGATETTTATVDSTTADMGTEKSHHPKHTEF